MKKLIIAPNSFKEVINPVEISGKFAGNLRQKFKGEIFIKPLSDGGDGFLNVCNYYFKSEIKNYPITNCYDDNLIKVPVAYTRVNRTLFIESAEILGLKTIPLKNRNPLKNSSKGLGDLLLRLKMEGKDIEKIIIGIGGTGTNDLGLGVCNRFGLKLFDKQKNELDVIPENFVKAESIFWKNPDLPFKIEVIVDVENTLTGEYGAAEIFARQKGASETDIALLENGFKNILKILTEKKGINIPEKLSGAGGGLAAGLNIFFNAEIKTASDFIYKDLGFNDLKNDADFVITGEGSFDSQSFMNKGTGIILNIFKGTKAKIFLVCGVIDKEVKFNLDKNIIPIELSSFFKTKEESIQNIDEGITLACRKILQKINID